mmetsp:Transcript_18786/g.45036  ORF Transcript_18786/g.45036 Transcript_18786/m.45036 type:complete len:180 (-) Transcript_18786:80-619(-)
MSEEEVPSNCEWCQACLKEQFETWKRLPFDKRDQPEIQLLIQFHENRIVDNIAAHTEMHPLPCLERALLQLKSEIWGPPDPRDLDPETGLELCFAGGRPESAIAEGAAAGHSCQPAADRLVAEWKMLPLDRKDDPFGSFFILFAKLRFANTYAEMMGECEIEGCVQRAMNAACGWSMPQ